MDRHTVPQDQLDGLTSARTDVQFAHEPQFTTLSGAAMSNRKLSRRQALLAAAAVPVAGGGLWAALQTGSSPGEVSAQQIRFEDVPAGFRRLRAAPALAQLSERADEMTAVWAYEGSAPGPEIRAVAGDRVRVRLENGLEQSTAVHWHGISIDNDMDGVPGLTQNAVSAGEVFDYDFVVPDPGTYWYHTHDRSWEQNARGLHGALIVEEPEPYDVDRDLTLVIDDWRLDGRSQIDEDSMGAAGDWSHGGRMGGLLTVNGRSTPDIDVVAGERIRMRLINTANARILGVSFGDLPASMVALDGYPIEPREVDEPVVLGPAQRVDVVVDMTGDPGAVGQLDLLTQEGAAPGATFRYGPDEPIRTSFPDVPALPSRTPGSAALHLDDPVRVDLLMEGGAMGGMSAATLDGQTLAMPELMDARRFWAFNGVAGDLDMPLTTVARDRTVVVTIQNQTAFPHVMHLHGHHFQVITRGGVPAARPDWRDSELMGQGETVELAFHADNPGKWLLHCHMLEHAAAGMMTWLDVT